MNFSDLSYEPGFSPLVWLNIIELTVSVTILFGIFLVVNVISDKDQFKPKDVIMALGLISVGTFLLSLLFFQMDSSTARKPVSYQLAPTVATVSTHDNLVGVDYPQPVIKLTHATYGNAHQIKLSKVEPKLDYKHIKVGDVVTVSAKKTVPVDVLNANENDAMKFKLHVLKVQRHMDNHQNDDLKTVYEAK